MTQPEGDGNLVFNPVLLETAAKVLNGKPENPAVTKANATTVNVAAFGTVPGGADAGGRVTTWVGQAKTELGHVAVDVADLGERTGRAATMAAEVNPLTKAAAEMGTPTHTYQAPDVPGR